MCRVEISVLLIPHATQLFEHQRIQSAVWSLIAAPRATEIRHTIWLWSSTSAAVVPSLRLNLFNYVFDGFYCFYFLTFVAIQIAFSFQFYRKFFIILLHSEDIVPNLLSIESKLCSRHREPNHCVSFSIDASVIEQSKNESIPRV